MNNEQVGKLIRSLRLEKKMTQKALSEVLNVTEQAVSKWERGIGLPDISLLPRLSDCLGVNLIEMLQGALNENDSKGARMKKIQFYVCHTCENLVFSAGMPRVSCCRRNLRKCPANEANEIQKMEVREVDSEWYVMSNHSMEKDDYISFSAYLVNGQLSVKSHYPEWSFELRLPIKGKGILYWYSKKEGLLFQTL